MKITAEQLQNDISALEGQLEQMKASVAQTTGALSVLRNIKAYVEAPEPTADEIAPDGTKLDISDENAEIQKTVQDRQDAALSLQQVAELVAGPGATAEEPVALEEPTVVKISDGVRMVADGRGMYHPVPMEAQ